VFKELNNEAAAGKEGPMSASNAQQIKRIRNYTSI
jgi:hypothetical protein